MTENLFRDFVEAARALLKRPGFALLVCLPLGFGIGAVTTVFSGVYGVLLKPPPYAEPDRLVQVWERRPRLPMPDEVAAFSSDHFRQWRDANTVFDGMAMYGDRPASYAGLAGSPGEPRPLSAEQVSPNLFEVLGVHPLLGRAFAADEEIPGRDGVVILGHAFWNREFGGDPEVVGRSLVLDERLHEVIGVMPPGFGFPNPQISLYLPATREPDEALQPGQVRLELVQVVARLGAGVSIEQAEAEAGALLERLSGESEIERMLNEGVSVHLASFVERSTGRLREPLIALLGVAALVLLIACGNVANLMLTRAAGRERELAVRAALGAGRGRVFRRLFSESLLLALAAGALGALLSLQGAGLLRSLTVLGLPQLARTTVEWPVLAFCFLAAAAAAIVFGAAPALRAASRDPAAALGASERGDAAPLGGAARSAGSRGLFASLQVALSLPLLVGAGLFVRSFLNQIAAPPGYQPENTVVFDLRLPEARYADETAQTAALDRIREEVAAVHGVLQVGLVDTLPLSGERAVIGFQRLGDEPATDPNTVPRALLRRVSPGYFRAMGIPLRRGRVFEEADRANADSVVIVNRSLVDRYLEDEPVDLELPGLGQIVGVVGDVHAEGVDTPVEPILYRLIGDARVPAPRRGGGMGGFAHMSLVLRHAPGTAVAEAAAARVAAVDPELRALGLTTLEARLGESVAQPRLYALLLGGFAAAAGLLAAFGVFGVVGWRANAALPAHGVRMAFGARPADIRRLVLRDGFRIALFGLVPGLLLAGFLTRVAGSDLSPLLFTVEPFDPAVFLLAPVALALAVLAASLGPAAEASRLDIREALRA